MLIYIVEDDDNIRELVLYTLHSSGYQAEGFNDGEGFYLALKEKKPDLLLLDIMLPKKDGISILKELRASQETALLPVIMLTAKSAEVDKVIGLDSGADDYIAKPFGMMELLSRIRAVLRRTHPQTEQAALTHKTLQVNLDRHQVAVAGEPVELTLKEYDLLVYLLRHKGMALTRTQILEAVWGYDVVVESRTVDVHIQTLRQKLGDFSRHIETVRGVGYRMEV